MGVASIGLGTGLFGASASFEVLVLAFAPALIAMLAVAVQSTFARPSKDDRVAKLRGT